MNDQDGLAKKRRTLVEEPIINEEFVFGPWEIRTWEFPVYTGDRIKGIVEEHRGDWLRIYLMGEKNYARKVARLNFNYLGGTDIGAYSIDYRVDEDETFYLVVEHADWWGNREKVRVKLNRLYYESTK